jgi:hypothetical protein
VRHLCFCYDHTPKERLNVSNSAALLPRPDSHMIGRGTNSSNKINATESTNQLIWTVPQPYGATAGEAKTWRRAPFAAYKALSGASSIRGEKRKTPLRYACCVISHQG